jgi:hypothetical protein
MVCLFRKNDHYRFLIQKAREAAVELRKPYAREIIGKMCPMHCTTRWIYDYPLVRFLCNNYEIATTLLESKGLELSPEINLLIPLLEKVFETMRIFEADDAPLACVVPQITKLVEYLQRHANRSGNESVTEIYHDAIELIRHKCLSTVNFIFQLAYVLTPEGRTLAREVLLDRPMFENESYELVEEEFNDHLSCAGLDSRYDQEDVEADNQDMLETEEEDRESAESESMDDTDFSEDDNLIASECPLFQEAEEGLREILLQFQLNVDEMNDVIGSFQNYVGAAPTDLCLKPIPKKNRYSWIVSHQNDEIHQILSDIAQRIEAMVCNEAVTERTNSAMKRILSPFRLRMGSNVLLSRLTIARHGTQEAKKVHRSKDPDDTSDN